MNYIPKPIDTSKIFLPRDLIVLSELLAKNAHEVWAKKRLSEGWKCGSEIKNKSKKSNNLIPFEELPESEKEYDRAMVLETIKSIIALGYSIERRNDS
jgi:hypothetical protein